MTVMMRTKLIFPQVRKTTLPFIANLSAAGRYEFFILSVIGILSFCFFLYFVRKSPETDDEKKEFNQDGKLYFISRFPKCRIIVRRKENLDLLAWFFRPNRRINEEVGWRSKWRCWWRWVQIESPDVANENLLRNGNDFPGRQKRSERVAIVKKEKNKYPKCSHFGAFDPAFGVMLSCRKRNMKII